MELFIKEANFEMPKAEIIIFDNEDVIITSGNTMPFVPFNLMNTDW